VTSEVTGEVTSEVVSEDEQFLDEGNDEASVPATDPLVQYTWPQLFDVNYGQIVEVLLKGGGITGAGSYNRIDAQALRLKAADIAASLTYQMFQKG